jgi:alpha-L-rhamnosidase
MKAIYLKTEYLAEPLGIDIEKPRFYWNCEGGAEQTAYQIIAKRTEEVVWDSKKIKSSSMTHICYEGKPLKSRDRISWSVKLWDENDIGGDWVMSWFEMGLLEKADWTGKWISGDYAPNKNTRYPVDCFRKKFCFTRQVKHARLYISACGLYEAMLNGAAVTNYRLTPGSTDYRKRIQYQTYDITEMLTGENTIEVQLADGWFRGSIGAFGTRCVYGAETRLLCQLEIIYADDSTETIVSDDSWDWCNDGPIRFADLKDGEIVDANDMPSYNKKAKVSSFSFTPSASNNVAPAEHEVFQAKLIITPSKAVILDFGQNIAGFIAFTVEAPKGQTVKLRLGETLDENGEFTQSNIQVKATVKKSGFVKEAMLASGSKSRLIGALKDTPLQEIVYICKGEKDDYKTKFAVFGFRYALIETDIDFFPKSFKAIAVYSDMELTGDFKCSNEDVNKLFQNTLWSMKGNFLDVPTDCPTRERLGWTGDAQIFFNTAAYLMNVASFYRKFMIDICDNIQKSGKPSAVAPLSGAAFVYTATGGSVGWADAIVLIPYRFWKRYGDIRILKEFYEDMRKYAFAMIKNTGHKSKKVAKVNPYNKYVYEKGFHLGEWLEPEAFKEKITAGKQILHTEECTAYLHYTMSIMVEIAETLDKNDDMKLFSEYAKGAKKAYNYLFADTFDTDRQAKLVRPLAFGLLDDGIKEQVEKRLVKAVRNKSYTVQTGFLSTPFLLPVLTEAGNLDIAYKMLENTQSPGWIYEVKQGATTVWENWEGKASLNHYSPGAVCEWLFHTVSGINLSGENKFSISPRPGGTLNYTNCSYQSIYGKVAVKWLKNAGKTSYEIMIPENCFADISLPCGTCKSVGSGVYDFEETDENI